MSKFCVLFLLSVAIFLSACGATNRASSSSSASTSVSSSSAAVPLSCPFDVKGGLMISEIVAKSEIPDYLSGADWVEFQNTGPAAVSLDQYFIKDSNSVSVQLPKVILQPCEYYVMAATDAVAASGDPYLPFKLGSDDAISLYAGEQLVDSLVWTKNDAKQGRSYGRLDGSAQTLYPTPGMANVPYILFSNNEVFTVKIKMRESDWQDLLLNSREEFWYPADLEFNGAIITDIAVRTKGLSSLNRVARLKPDHKSYGRYSFKLDFNKYKEQKFMGMKRLVFNNGYGDPTLMRDALAYRLLKTVEAPASELSYIDLWVAGKHMGIYQMIEPVDGEYVEKYFPDDKDKNLKGDLYKAFSSLEWKPGQTLSYFTTGDFPQLELKTNEETMGTVAEGKALMAFLESINSGSVEHIDTDVMTRYIAASVLISNYDSYFANKGNYYLYEHRSIGGVAMLPWDFNLGFGRVYDQGPAGCKDPVLLIDNPTVVPLAQRPMVARVLERENLRNEYHGHLHALLERIFNPTAIRSYLQRQRNLIDAYVKNDPTFFYSYEAWQQSFTEDVSGGTDFFGKAGALLPFIDARYENVRRQLSGEIPSSNDGSGACPQ